MPLFILSKTAVDIDYNLHQRDNLVYSLNSLLETDTALYRDNPNTKLGKL